MKLFKTVLINSIIILNVSNSFSQNNIYVAAFSKSYQCEYNKDYEGAIKSILDKYDSKSYEVNLRLGWLYYKAEKFNESVQYYQNAIGMKPSSIEAKGWLIFPLAS